MLLKTVSAPKKPEKRGLKPKQIIKFTKWAVLLIKVVFCYKKCGSN